MVLVGMVTTGEFTTVGGGIPLTLAWPTVSTDSSKMCGFPGGG